MTRKIRKQKKSKGISFKESEKCRKLDDFNKNTCHNKVPPKNERKK